MPKYKIKKYIKSFTMLNIKKHLYFFYKKDKPISQKSWILTLIFTVLVGWLGADLFYLGFLTSGFLLMFFILCGTSFAFFGQGQFNGVIGVIFQCIGIVWYIKNVIFTTIGYRLDKKGERVISKYGLAKNLFIFAVIISFFALVLKFTFPYISNLLFNKLISKIA
jgi:hypothetical protein